MKKNVLVFPSSTEVANEIIASMENNKNFEVLLASSEGLAYSSFRKNKTYYLPYVEDKSFFEELSVLISSINIDFIIPAHDDVAYTLSEIEGKISAKVIGQNYATNKIVRFKDESYKYFKGIIPIGKIYDNIREVTDFPIFVKPKKGQGSHNAFDIKNDDELEVFNQNFNSKDYVLMECFTGDEYTIDCFSHNGKVLYSGARTRDKTLKGISVISKSINDELLNTEFRKYAQIISSEFYMHGLWFFQMKKDKYGKLQLLEIATRVSGTMMLNRAKGINFVELALYQAQGFDVEVITNDVDVSVGRALTAAYKHNYQFDTLYVDFDDTLFIDEKYINTDLIKLIFQCKNEKKEIILITKNKKNNLANILLKFGISSIFDDIYHLRDSDFKKNYMVKNSILVDDSFAERADVIKSGYQAIGVDGIKFLLNV